MVGNPTIDFPTILMVHGLPRVDDCTINPTSKAHLAHEWAMSEGQPVHAWRAPQCSTLSARAAEVLKPRAERRSWTRRNTQHHAVALGEPARAYQEQRHGELARQGWAARICVVLEVRAIVLDEVTGVRRARTYWSWA